MQRRQAWALGVLLVVMACQTASLMALDDFYMQNGDAYLLIGNGPKNGVYKLNNLIPGGTPVSLYVPGEAFNLSASMKPVAGNPPTKELWTFASAGTTGMHGATQPLVRKVLTSVHLDPAQPGLPAYTGLRDKIAHVHHNYPGQTISGVGIHDPHSYPVPYTANFDGNDYPCTWTPTPVPGQPGYFYVQSGRWYHSGDDAEQIYSSFTYLKPDWWGTTAPSVIGAYNMYGFVQCTDGAGNPFLGGWCHKLVRETVQVDERILNLIEFNVSRYLAGLPAGPNNQGEAGRVVISSTNTKDTLNECGDPCAPGTGPGTPLPFGEQPYMDCLVSGAGRSYLYNRQPSSPVYSLTLNGAAYGGSTIGNPSEATAKKLGVSSRSPTTDWVYVLGITEVNNWLAAAHVPASAFLRELTDVAVSDQWWQTGGIVYAYDKQQGFVYKFVRNEVSGVPPLPEVINVYDGTIYPDSIDADGFGNLYFVKTERSPANVPGTDMPTFSAGQAVGHYKKSPMVADLFAAKFEQVVYKGVTMRDYYRRTFTPIGQHITLGINQFEMDFTCNPASLTDRSCWTMIPPLRRTSPDVATNYRTEVAVINVCTPPPVSGTDAKIDLNGPLVGPTEDSLVNAPTPYDDRTQYFFRVENAPKFDENGVNLNGMATDDFNGNSFPGMFPTTTKPSTLKYFWKLTQTKNRYGEPLNNVVKDGLTPSDKPILPVMFGPGEWEIAVRSEYQYYQYDRMPAGVLSDRKEDYISGTLSPRSLDGTGWARAVINIQTATDTRYPGGPCVIMSGQPSGGSYVYHPTLDGSLNSEWAAERAAPAAPPAAFYVIPQIKAGQTWAFQVRENQQNRRNGIDRIALMTAANPPIPAESYSDLQWLGLPKFSWKISLTDPTGATKLVEITKEPTVPQLIAAPGQQMFEIPSEPGSYSVHVDAARTYSYVYYYLQAVTLPNGAVVQVPKSDTKYITISAGADATVIVLDTTPPGRTLPDLAGAAQAAWTMDTSTLWGTTGDLLAAAVDGKTNPTAITLWVADDNPYGNVTVHPNITNKPSDPFFSSYKVKHDGGWRIATFSYTNAYTETVPDALAAAVTPSRVRYQSAPDGSNNWPSSAYAVRQADYDFNTLPTGTGLAKVRSWSYRRYQIDLSALAHFTRDNATTYRPNMEITYANNLPAYVNLKFGWGVSDASNNVFRPPHDGNLVVRDNDRPNVFLRAVSERRLTENLIAPSNIDPLHYATRWTQLARGTGVSEDVSGVAHWTYGGGALNAPTPLTDVAVGFRFSAAGVTTSLAQEVVNGTSTLEIDVPAQFSTILADNVGTTTRTLWRLLDSSGSLITDMGTAPGFRYIFRDAGYYLVNVRVNDDALDWPTDVNNPRVAVSRPNSRELTAVVPVADSRLNVRIIEKNVK